MAFIGREEPEKVKDGNVEKRKLIVTVDNGTLVQLDELKAHFGQTDNTELLKLAVSILQRAKDSQTRPTSQ
jgi:hypothetical protein